MAIYELLMPKMGESIMEATILGWSKQVGDTIEVDDTIIEIATDKVDSEIPSPVAGVIKEILFQVNDVVPIGTVIARIDTGGSADASVSTQAGAAVADTPTSSIEKSTEQSVSVNNDTDGRATSDRFYSPLVKNIAKEENISLRELDSLVGSGKDNRVTKQDLLDYIAQRKSGEVSSATTATTAHTTAKSSQPAATSTTFTPPAVSMSGDVEIIEMDRMRKLIADHMVMSKHVSPHVTSFIEVDVTNIVKWRDKVKKEFISKHGQNITFTPVFIEAVAKAIADFPMINSSVDGTNIIRKKQVNIGMATALPSGNLIVPVIKGADMLNLVGLTKSVNDLANRARNNQLKPEDIKDGTFTLTNVGGFGNVMGTPIINQPQVAILAVGAIKKKPAVLETPDGDVIAIRHMMFLSLSYDHRIVDGSLGGSFLRRVGDYLEAFDYNQTI